MKLIALTAMAGKVMIDAGQQFEEPNQTIALRLIAAGHAEPVETLPLNLKETAKSKPAANREIRGGQTIKSDASI